ncbi:MAG TPA: hypothetical protein VFZ66_14350 [Herpetosiphonaceae bacterium]
MAVTHIPIKGVEERARERVATGEAAAAFIAGGIGCFIIGLLTTAAVISEPLKNALNWWNPAGPLTGKTGVGVIAFFISWAIGHVLWNDRDVDLRRTFIITMILLALGFVLTFPPVFEYFE